LYYFSPILVIDIFPLLIIEIFPYFSPTNDKNVHSGRMNLEAGIKMKPISADVKVQRLRAAFLDGWVCYGLAWSAPIIPSHASPLLLAQLPSIISALFMALSLLF
jgi:hypothetical protein